MTRGGPILLIDTATTQAVIAVGANDGSLLEQRRWTAGYRHGEELLARIEALLADQDLAPGSLGAIAVGTGPGAFTGLRVGIATAKGLAHALAVPIVGIASGTGLLDAGDAAARMAGGAATDAHGRVPLVLLQPAGPNDRVVVRRGEPARIIVGGAEIELRDGERLLAVDLAGRAEAEAVALGEAAVAGLAEAMLAAAARRLAAGDEDDLATLVPEYVTLPRGVRMPPPDAGVEVTGTAPADGRGASS